MGFLETIYFGVKLWIILYFVFSILIGAFVICWFYRERIRKHYYIVKCPELLIKAIMHYEGNMIREYWRIIPINEEIFIAGQCYGFDKTYLLKFSEDFAEKKKEQWIIKIGDKEFKFNKPAVITKRFRAFPEIHYFYNVPVPIRFDAIKGKVEFSTDALEQFKENDLLKKLLTLEDEKRMMILLMVIGVINLAATGFVIAKLMGWLK